MGYDVSMPSGGQWVSLLDGTIKGASSGGAWPGDPGDGNYYVGWAAGPGAGGRGTLSVGQSKSSNKISVFHNYSTASNNQVSIPMIDEAIAAGVIASQSFKLASKGNETQGPIDIVNGLWDSTIRQNARDCKARAPWPIILCYYHEPGGNFTTDSMRANYRAAFRYIVGIFRDEGVTNVTWTQIQEAPYDFRPTPLPGGSLGGGRNVDWRKFHPDWNGGTTGTIADWYTGDDQVCDIFGLDIYNPLAPNGTSFQPYDRIWRDVQYQWDQTSFPIENYGGCGIFEMGWSDVIDPDPDWVAYAAATLTEQSNHNIKLFTYWDNNNATPPRYDFASGGNASDVDGDKYLGWQDICTGATLWTP